MNRKQARGQEVADTIRGEIRRAAERAVDAFATLEGLSALGLASSDELFAGADPAVLRSLARQFRALSAQGTRSFAEIEHVTGRIEALAALREVNGS